MTVGSDEPDIDLVAQYGDVFSTKYLTQDVLGKGISSVVRKCTHRKTYVQYAVKIIDLHVGSSQEGDAIREEYLNEVAIIRKLSEEPGHPNIILLHDFVETPTYFFLVFELCTGGELFDHLTDVVTLSEKQTRHMMQNILEAVQYIHSHNIVHRDLKPENILLDEHLNVKISDFGMARVLGDGELLTELCGTPGYLSPEALKCNMQIDGVEGYSKEVDLWACGVIMYTLLVGCPPFWHRRQVIMLRHIMGGNYTFGPEWDDISESPKELITKLLVVNPEGRLTATETLQHKFFDLASSETPEEKESSPKRRFKTAVLTVQGLCRLQHYSGHRPVRIEAARQNPYQYKPIRKVIDSLAFGIYGHWVKKGEGQNRAALFQNTPKVEMKQTHVSQLNLEANGGLDESSFRLDPAALTAAMGRRRGDMGPRSPEIKVDKVDWYQ